MKYIKWIMAGVLLVVLVAVYVVSGYAASEIAISETDVTYLAKTLYGECRRDTIPYEQKAAVAWVVLNRVDSPDYPDSVKDVVTEHKQFTGYKKSHPVTDELKQIAVDVLVRWEFEKMGYEEVGRTIPRGYYFFRSYNKMNRFRAEYEDTKYWDWKLSNPYANGLFLDERSLTALESCGNMNINKDK